MNLNCVRLHEPQKLNVPSSLFHIDFGPDARLEFFYRMDIQRLTVTFPPWSSDSIWVGQSNFLVAFWQYSRSILLIVNQCLLRNRPKCVLNIFSNLNIRLSPSVGNHNLVRCAYTVFGLEITYLSWTLKIAIISFLAPIFSCAWNHLS